MEVFVMPGIKVGDFIGVFCEVQPGPFSEERVVTIETVHGPISGFVRQENLRQTDRGWVVRAQVRAITSETIDVLMKGSFFTTNGVASVPKRLAMAA
jgi:hypothetical protein